MDYVSVLLGLISVLQGLRDSNRGSISVDVIQGIFSKMVQLDRVLYYSKDIHDQVEDFQRIMAESIDVLVHEVTSDRLLIISHGDKYTNGIQSLADKLPYDIQELTGSESIGNITGQVIPVIERSIKDIYNSYPTICEFVSKDLANNIRILQDLTSANRHNDDAFLKQVKYCHHLLLQALWKADKVILGSAHVMSFLHSKAQDSLN